MPRKKDNTILKILENVVDYEKYEVQDNNEKFEISYIGLNDIRENIFNNKRIINDEDVVSLSENIFLTELQQPLVVCKRDNSDITLISGHRRLKALKKLLQDGKAYKFNGETLSDVAPCIVRTYTSIIEEKLGVLVGNSHKEENDEEKITRTLQAKELYDECINDNDSMLSGCTKHEFISAITGYSERSVARYLKKAGETKDYKASKQEDSDNLYEDYSKQLSSHLKTEVLFKKKRIEISFKDENELDRVYKILMGINN